MKGKINLSKREMKICIISTILIVSAICLALVKYKIDDKYKGIQTRTMTYTRVKDGDEATNCEFIKFDAFFLKDVDGDGIADGVRGSCNQIGKEDNLYFEIKVEKDGYLENGKITINTTNSYLYAALVKDSGIKDNYIGPNIKEIELNKLSNGMQKLIITSIRSGDYSLSSESMNAINNNINNYSDINSVTFTGTHVSEDGTITEIEKTIEFNVDWYGKLNTEIPEVIRLDQSNLNHEYSFNELLDENGETLTLDFKVGVQENRYQSLISKSVIEGNIPELNGSKPLNVEISGIGVTYKYDNETGYYIAQRESVIDEDGNVITQAYTDVYENNRINEYEFHIEYPAEAYDDLDASVYNLPLLVNAYYEGFNNSGEEFDNPFKSNIATESVYFRLYKEGVGGHVGIRIGNRITNPVKRYIIEKSKPLRMYNGISEIEKDDTYIVKWNLKSNSDGAKSTVIKETKDGEAQVSDEFITAENEHISTENIVKNIGIGMLDPIETLGENGWIKIFDDETDELIVTFTKDNWTKYTKDNYYKYKVPIKHIRVETSGFKPESYVTIYNIKEIDDEALVNNFTKDEFTTLKRIISYVVAYVDGSYFDKNEYIASYEAPVSVATLTLSKKEFTTQTSYTNTKMTIEAQTDITANQKKWINGTFLIKFPEEILGIEIKDIQIDNKNVEIVSYEIFEENNCKFLRIMTNNEKESTFNIDLDCDISIDPRVLTVSKNIELYATNENDTDYYYSTKDIYDVNQNGNKDEVVNCTNSEIIIIAPSILLTNQTAMEYGIPDKVTIAPETAYVSKEQRSAKINIELNNNYSSTVSEVVILGKVPFKGNKYVIANNDLGSTFTCTMKNTGIVVPEELLDFAKVYYSENENPTRDVYNTENGWTESLVDFSKVKSYMIDLGEKNIEPSKSYNFYYEIEIPEGLKFDDVTYSHYGLYFSLDTLGGKYRTQAEPNRLGFMIAKEYELDVIKYQKGKNKTVDKAIYRIIEEGKEDSKTRATANGGKLTVSGLLLGKTYKIKEIKTPEQYELNTDEIVFKTYEENDDIALDFISGNARSAKVIREDGKDSKIQIEVEDEVRADLQILKIDAETNFTLRNIRYKISGKGLAENGKIQNTDINGIISLSGLFLNEEYTIEEIKADGYYLSEAIKVKLINENGEYKIQTAGNVKNSYVTTEDDVPKINLELQNTKIPTYNIEITKVKKDTNEPLQGAKFRLIRDNKILGEYETNENGQLVIPDLIINDEANNIQNTYTIKESVAPAGFTKIKDITFKVEKDGDNFKYIQESENQIESIVSGNTIKLKIEDFPAFKLIKKDGETANVLPGTKFTIYNIDNYVEEIARDSKGNIIGNLEDINGTQYYVLTTDENGEFTADLPEGVYKAVEVYAPEKYELPSLDARTYYFSVGQHREGDLNYRITSGHKLAKNLTTNVDTVIKQVAETSDKGNVSVGTFSNGEIMLTDGTVIKNEGEEDTFIQKYDANNNLQWFYNFGGVKDDELCDVIVTSDDNILAAGYFRGSITLSNGVTLNSGGDNTRAGIIIKYSEEGEILWYDVIDGTRHERIFDILERVNEKGETEYIAIGMLRSTNIELSNGEVVGRKIKEDIFIAIYTEDGIIKNFKIIGGSSNNIGTNIHIDTTDDYGFVILAEFYDTFTSLSNEQISREYSYETTSLISNVTMKINSNFEIVWENSNMASETSLNIGGISSTNDGGCIYAINSRKPVTLSNGEIFTPTAPDGDTCIIKCNASGEIEWKEMYNSTSVSKTYDVKRAKDGNVLLATRFAGTITIGENTFNESSYTGYVVKYDQNGNKLLFQAVLTEGNNRIEGIAETSSADILVAGYFKNKVHFYGGQTLINENTKQDNGVVLKLEEVNIKAIEETTVDKYTGSGNEKLRSVVATNDGGYATVGFFENTITLKNGDTYTSKRKTDSIFVKYNSTGIIEHSFVVSGDEHDYFRYITKTNDNGYLICGYTNSKEIILPNGEVKTFPVSKTKGIIIKVSEQFEIEWIEFLEGSDTVELKSIEETQDGGFVACGKFETTLTLNNNITLASNGEEDIFVVKFDSTREIEWAKKIGGISVDEANCVTQIKDGSIIVVGEYSSPILEQGNEILGINGTRQGIIIKYDKDGTRKSVLNVGNTISCVCSAKDGGYVVGGYTAKDNTIGNLAVEHKGVIAIKFDSNDKIVWTNGYEGYGRIYSIKETKECEYLIAGFSDNGEIILDNGDIVQLTGYTDPTLGKIGNDGKTVWLIGLVGDKDYSDDRFEGVAELNDGGIVATGYFESTKLNLKNGQILNNVTNDGHCDGLVLKFVDKGINAENVQEITAYNYVKRFKIKTEVLENNGIKGGTISGELAEVYEKVKYSENSIKDIKITPDTDYKIKKILINNEEIPFTPDENGCYTLDKFTSVIEDKTIQVSFLRTSNEFVLEKYAEDNVTPLSGVKFRIEQIEQAEGSEILLNPIEEKTNKDGKINIELPIGKYKITEIETVDGYQLLENSIEYEMIPEGPNILKINNKELRKVIVHHYLKDTETSVAEDEIILGKTNEEYSTSPKTNLEKYELIKDENGSYIVPDNASGVFHETSALEVTYYYTSKKIPLKINHYILGTTQRITLEDGTIVEEKIEYGEENKEYHTEPIIENLNHIYELVETPINASGVFQGKEIIVNYYYKIKEYKVTTKVIGEGGSITSQNEKYHEIVKAGEKITKNIEVIPDENYEIKTITINGINYNYTENEERKVIITDIGEIKEDTEIVVSFGTLSETINFTVEYYKDNEKIEPYTQRIVQEIDNVNVNSLYCWSLSELNYRKLEKLVNSLEISTLNVSVSKEKIDSAEFEKLVDFCETKRLELYLLVGKSNWYTIDNSLNLREIADKIAEYNAKRKFHINGIVGDIEFYTLEEYKVSTKEERKEYFKQYVDTVEYNIQYLKNLNLDYVVCMPTWLHSIDYGLLEKLMSLDCKRYEIMNYSKKYMMDSLDEEIELAKKYNKQIISIGEFAPVSDKVSDDESMANDGIEYFLNIQEQLNSKYKYDNLFFGYHHYRVLKDIELPNAEQTYKLEAYPYSNEGTTQLTDVYAISGKEVIKGIPSVTSSSGEYILEFYGMKYDKEYTIEVVGSRFATSEESKVISFSDKNEKTKYITLHLEERFPDYKIETIKEDENEVPVIPGIIKNGSVIKIYYSLNTEKTIEIEVTKVWKDNEVQSLRRPNTIKFVVMPYEESKEEGIVTSEVEVPKNIEEVSETVSSEEKNTLNNLENTEDIDKNIDDKIKNNEENIPENIDDDNLNGIIGELINDEEKEEITETQEKISIKNDMTEEVPKDLHTDYIESEKDEIDIVEEENNKEIEELIIPEDTNTDFEQADNNTVSENQVIIDGKKLDYYVFEFPNQIVNRNESSKKYKLGGVLKYDETTGKEIQYIVKELEDYVGDLKFYERTDGIVEKGKDKKGRDIYTTEITNTFRLPEENSKDIKVTKIWKDNDNKGLIRPSSIVIDLIGRVKENIATVSSLEEGKDTTENIQYKDVVLKTENISSIQSWKHIFMQNPIYDENGQEIEYTVEEKSPETNKDALNLYIGEVSEINDQNEIIVTNTSIVNDSKIEKIGPEKVNAIDSKFSYNINYTVELNVNYQDENVEFTVVDSLPYKLSDKERNLAGGEYNEEAQTITWTGKYNTNAEEQVVVWNDGSKTPVTLDEENSVKVVTFNKEISFAYLGITVEDENKTITNNVSGTVKLEKSEETVNAKCETVTEWTKDVIVNKMWNGDTEETRPDSISVELKQVVEKVNENEKIIQEIVDVQDEITAEREDVKSPVTILPTATEDGKTQWTYTWTNLPRYDLEGKEINYTVDETGINYTKGEQTVENQYYCEKTEEVIDGNTVVTLTNNKYGSITVTKVDSRKEDIKLQGAEFKLERVIKSELSEDGKFEWIVPDENSEEYAIATGITGEDGTLIFNNLKYGYYKLTETKAPEDYRIAEKDIEVIEVSAENPEKLNVQVTVKNDKQYSLPTTGGIGTNIVRSAEILGLIILVILITNRKKIVPERRTKTENKVKPVRRNQGK